MDNEEYLVPAENTNNEDSTDNTEFFEFSKKSTKEETAKAAEIEYENSDSTEDEEGNDKLRLMITTADNIIAGDLLIPEVIDFYEDDTSEDILFRTLNCGNQFIALKNSSIMDRDNTEFEPERIPYFIVNTDIIETCRLVPDKKR